MRRRLRRTAVQMDLFHPQPTQPLWKALPLEVRQQVHALVVQLLKERRSAKGKANE